MKTKLTHYGIRELAIATAALWALVALACLLVRPMVLGAALALLPAAVWGWVIWFFRDPDRPTPRESGLFISPADGTVTDITPLGPDSLLGRGGVQIGIFMSVFSVHVNRSPADATVVRVEHKAGAFLDARDPACSQRNESATIFLNYAAAGKQFPLIIRQIAGLIARRIVTDLTAGQTLARGQRIGMIKFGSRMEVLLPSELAGQICVRLGQKVQAGLSVLARTPENMP